MHADLVMLLYVSPPDMIDSQISSDVGLYLAINSEVSRRLSLISEMQSQFRTLSFPSKKPGSLACITTSVAAVLLEVSMKFRIISFSGIAQNSSNKVPRAVADVAAFSLINKQKNEEKKPKKKKKTLGLSCTLC